MQSTTDICLCPEHKQAETQLICQTRRGHESCPSSAHTSRTAVSLLPHGDLAESGLVPKRLLGFSCRSKDRHPQRSQLAGHTDVQAGSSGRCRSSFVPSLQQLPHTARVPGAAPQYRVRGAGCTRAHALGWANASEPAPEQTCGSLGASSQPQGGWRAVRADVELVQPSAPGCWRRG